MGAWYDGGGDPGQAGPDLPTLVARARRRDGLMLLEGVHALKHASRFGARLHAVVTPDLDALTGLLAELAPDVVVPAGVVEVDQARWRQLAGRELPSPALAVADHPGDGASAAWADRGGRLVVLEQPRHLGNLGAVVRVAAAAGAAGVIVLGDADPWHPTAVRAAAGLQHALPVGRLRGLPPDEGGRPVLAVDPAGPPLGRAAVPDDAVLVFGTERGGLSGPLLARADARVSIPMRAGVSSLNLASAVAVTLYAG